MSQGFFQISDNCYLPEAVRQATRSVLRFNTGRLLHHRLFDSQEDAQAWSGFVADEHGRDTFQAGWTQETIEALDCTIGSPDWASGFQHELVTHLAHGGHLPYKTEHAGSATATLVSSKGHILTNLHLITAQSWYDSYTEVAVNQDTVTFNGLPLNTFSSEGVSAPHIELYTEDHQPLGSVRILYLSLELDLAVLQLLKLASLPPVKTRDTPLKRHEPIWQWGYPPHTAREKMIRNFLGYHNASGQLTYSPGLVLSDPTEPMWYTDADAAFGSSGSAIIGIDGTLVGVRCGGGARMLPKSEWFKYNRSTDVYALKNVLPTEVFDVQ